MGMSDKRLHPMQATWAGATVKTMGRKSPGGCAVSLGDWVWGGEDRGEGAKGV